MHNRHGGWWGLSGPVAGALAATGGAALVAGSLPYAGLPALGDALGRGAVAAAGLMVVAVLSMRGWRASRRGRAAWWLLAAAAIGLAGQALGTWAGRDVAVAGADLPAVGLGLAVMLALWLLPAPDANRREMVRTVLDAASAGFAFAVPVSEALLPDGFGVWPASWALAHPLLDVGLASVAVAVVARARRPGGVAMLPLALLATGTALLAVTDIRARQGADATQVMALTAIVLLVWAVGALTVDDAGPDTESDRAMAWRERVAVLVPLMPLTVAAAVLGGSTAVGQPLRGVTLISSGLLVASLVSAGVLARLDSLVTERRLDELVLRRTLTIGEREKWFRALVQNSSDVITVVDGRGVVRFQTPSVTRILGHDPDQLVGTRFSSLLRPGDGRRLETALASAGRSPGRPLTLEFPIWAKDGSWCDTETTVTSLLHDPDIRGLVLNTRDVSERRRLEEQLTAQAFSDGLTGLANRTMFRTQVETALKVALAPAEVAVLFLDLDGFKAVNDAHGHHVGDELLGLVGKRLTNAVRPGDLVARLGGDEFAILVTGPGADRGARWAAERVSRALETPFVLDSRSLLLGASTGIAVSDTGDETADQLLRNADLAMYRAKGRRDKSYVRFEAQMHNDLLARVRAESDLREAIRNDDLVLHFQPVVELTSGLTVGVEALVRWRHPEIGIIGPGDFIELAEETGLITDIGRWALRESARQGALWQRYSLPGAPFKIAVNVSARQFDAGLPRLVRDVLADSGLPGPALTLEMTESVLMERSDEVVGLLRRIKALGVRVAVDDFGTGYSSLSYLSRFPVDLLKIDQSFVSHLGEASGQGELVRTIVQLGASLRLDTVAEGIETPAQRDALEEMGCAFGQGYLFARPMPVDEVTHLLEEQWRSLPATQTAASA